MAKKRVTHGISFPDEDVLNLARERARRLDLSLSKYINKLVKDDLAGRSALVFEEDADAYSPNPVARHLSGKAQRKAAGHD